MTEYRDLEWSELCRKNPDAINDTAYFWCIWTESAHGAMIVWCPGRASYHLGRIPKCRVQCPHPKRFESNPEFVESCPAGPPRMGCPSGADTVDQGGKLLYTLSQVHCARLPFQRPDRLSIFDMFRATASRTSAFNEASPTVSPLWKSMARSVLPCRLALKSFFGPFS